MTCTDLGYSRLVSVSTASGLGSALVNAQPGDLIVLADGTYTGRWTISRSGTAERPVVLCGSRAAILQDTRYDAGAVLTLSGVQHFVLHGFTVRKALWGVRLLSGSSYNQLSGLLIHDIGQEAVAINGFSSHNKVQGNEITHTGRRSGYERFGEGIYIGSTSARWTNGNPDRSDNNQILNNKIGPHVTADHLDIKEGTSGTIVRGNTFDGTGIQLHDSHYRALILTAGNHGLYENNILDAGSETPLSHGSWIWRGDNVEWGRENEFRNNTVDMRSAPGYGFYASSGSYTTSTTLLPCNSNAVKGAGSGPSNVKCK